jgi:hypothetical protein
MDADIEAMLFDGFSPSLSWTIAGFDPAGLN